MALTATTGTTLVGTAQRPVAAGASGAPLCIQLAFASSADHVAGQERDRDVHCHRGLDAVTAADRARRVLREVALTAGAVAGTLCLAFALLRSTAGIRPLVFTSGSMAPAIRTGDLAITRPVAVDRLAPGDVVSVGDPRGVRVTHRVVEVDAARHLLRLRGDANTVADQLPYAADRVDQVLFAVAAGGYVLSWLSGPTATLLLGAYAVFLLSVLRPRGGRRVTARDAMERGAPAWGRTDGRRAGDRRGSRGRRPGTAADPRGVLDTVPVGGTALTAYAVPKPVITSCTAMLTTVTVTWTAVSTPYALTYNAVVAETGQSLPVTTSTARYTPLLSSGGTTQTIQVTAALPATPAWTSVAANQTVRVAVLDLVPTCGAAS